MDLRGYNYKILVQVVALSAVFFAYRSSSCVSSEKRNHQTYLSFRIWAVPDCQKVLPNDAMESKNAIWNSQKDQVIIKGARNEVVAFQLVLRSEVELDKVNVTVSDLRGPAVIPQRQITLFRQWYLKCPPVPKEMVTLKGKEFPDPLIPFENPEKPHQQLGAPFRLLPHCNQPIWIDVKIPKNATAGEYRAVISVLLQATPLISLDLIVRVWNFELPKQTHLPAWVPLYWDRLRQQEELPYEAFSPRSWKVVQKYLKMAQKHRFITQVVDDGSEPDIEWDEQSGAIRSIDWSGFDRFLGPVLSGDLFDDNLPPALWKVGGWMWWGMQPGNKPHFGGNYQTDKTLTPAHRHALQNYIRAIESHFNKMGWTKTLLFTYMIDEPDYQYYPNLPYLIKDIGVAIHQVAKRTKILVTVPPQDSDEHFGGVDIWATTGALYWVPTMQARQQLGEMSWFYQYHEPFVGGHCLNHEGLGFRTWPWIAWKYHVDGIFYWCGNFWEDNVYHNAVNWNDEEISNGILFYPGRQLPQIGLPAIAGPISSVRMKALRRGLQDYEYLILASQRSLPATKQVVNSIIQSALNVKEYDPYWEHPLWAHPGDWNHDPNAWEKARAKLAEIILK